MVPGSTAPSLQKDSANEITPWLMANIPSLKGPLRSLVGCGMEEKEHRRKFNTKARAMGIQFTKIQDYGPLKAAVWRVRVEPLVGGGRQLF